MLKESLKNTIMSANVLNGIALRDSVNFKDYNFLANEMLFRGNP